MLAMPHGKQTLLWLPWRSCPGKRKIQQKGHKHVYRMSHFLVLATLNISVYMKGNVIVERKEERKERRERRERRERK